MSERLSDIFRTVNWQPVEDVIRLIDPEGTDGVPDLYIHRRIFDDMCRIEPGPSEDWLVVELRADDPDSHEEQESWVEVSCTDLQYEEHRGGESRYGIDFLPWAKCLGMRVTAESRANYSDAEIVAHCLREMTFYGQDEETIQEKAGRFSDISSKEIIPAEQALRELGL